MHLVGYNYRFHLIGTSYQERDVCKCISGYSWDKGSKCWTYPADPDTLKVLLTYFPDVNIDNTVYTEMDKKSKESIQLLKIKQDAYEHPDTSKYLNYEFYNHQAISFAFFKNFNSNIDFSEPGAGKTMVQIALMKFRDLKYTLIICPKALIDNVWEKDIVDFWGTHKKIFKLNSTVLNAEKILAEGQQGIYIMNYEKSWRIEPDLQRIPWDSIILDESSRIKNHNSKQSKSILKLDAEYKSIMTGTPAPNIMLEIFSQIRFVDNKILGSNFYSFQARYFDKYIIPNTNIPKISPKHGAIQAIKELYEPYAIAWKKSECLDLPPITTQTITCEMKGAQLKAYKEMAIDMITYIEGDVYDAPIVLTKLMRLAQISSGYLQNTDNEDLTFFKPNPKLDLLMELLGDIPNDCKAIIWCNFTQNILMIKDKLKQASVTYYGGTKDKDRVIAIDRFKNDPECRFFIAHPKCAGHGLTLTSANYALYYSTDYSYEGYQQSVDRINRISQTKPMTVYHLCCKGSNDNVVFKALAGKKTLNDLVKDIKAFAQVYNNS